MRYVHIDGIWDDTENNTITVVISGKVNEGNGTEGCVQKS